MVLMPFCVLSGSLKVNIIIYNYPLSYDNQKNIIIVHWELERF